MTPLEIAAKAVGDAFDGRPGWNERCAKAALRALAEAETAGDIADAGYSAFDAAKEFHMGAAFSAMLLAIAEEKGND
jgi:hypothetical protein